MCCCREAVGPRPGGSMTGSECAEATYFRGWPARRGDFLHFCIYTPFIHGDFGCKRLSAPSPLLSQRFKKGATAVRNHPISCRHLTAAGCNRHIPARSAAAAFCPCARLLFSYFQSFIIARFYHPHYSLYIFHYSFTLQPYTLHVRSGCMQCVFRIFMHIGMYIYYNNIYYIYNVYNLRKGLGAAHTRKSYM